jgi:hypothetical protein
MQVPNLAQVETKRITVWRPRYDNPIFSYGPPGYIGWRNRFLGIDSWLPKRLQVRAQNQNLQTSERTWMDQSSKEFCNCRQIDSQKTAFQKRHNDLREDSSPLLHSPRLSCQNRYCNDDIWTNRCLSAILVKTGTVTTTFEQIVICLSSPVYFSLLIRYSDNIWPIIVCPFSPLKYSLFLSVQELVLATTTFVPYQSLYVRSPSRSRRLSCQNKNLFLQRRLLYPNFVWPLSAS